MTVRIGLIGAGGMGRAHLARIHNDLSGGKIVAVADINLDAAKSAAEPYGAKAYGTSDELGMNAEENPVHVHDLHATILHQLGLDHEKLTYRYAGRDFRLTDVFGKVVTDILA